MQTIEWFVIANASRARVLSRRPGEPLRLVQAFEHPDHVRFAQVLAQFIDHEALAEHFAKLSVFAPAAFLGELKHELGAASVHRLCAAREVDLTRIELKQLPGVIEEALTH